MHWTSVPATRPHGRSSSEAGWDRSPGRSGCAWCARELSATGVTFERSERDGRNHSPWVLRADVAPIADGSVLTMRLHYGGSLWGPVLERLLRDEIERSRVRLLDRVAGR